MVYLVIKELSTVAEDVIMVTSSIMKDMQSNLDVIYRPNAIRALARIIDVGGESYLGQGNLLIVIARLNPFNLSKGYSNQPSSTDRPLSRPHLLYPHTTSTPCPRRSSSDGPTKPRKPSTPKPFRHQAPTVELHRRTSEEAVEEDSSQLPARATSCSTMPLDCYMS